MALHRLYRSSVHEVSGRRSRHNHFERHDQIHDKANASEIQRFEIRYDALQVLGRTLPPLWLPGCASITASRHAKMPMVNIIHRLHNHTSSFPRSPSKNFCTSFGSEASDLPPQPNRAPVVVKSNDKIANTSCAMTAAHSRWEFLVVTHGGKL